MKKKPDSSLISALENRGKSDENTAKEIIVIPDECGDTLWDAVLAQNEEKDKRAHQDDKHIAENEEKDKHTDEGKETNT
jgi:hypothetical protein